jgi:hypothetical protein
MPSGNSNAVGRTNTRELNASSQVNADDKKFGVNILYSCGNKTFSELTDFPNLEADSPEVAREKQRRLLGETAKAPAPKTISDQPEDEEKISDAPPPKVVNPALTGTLAGYRYWKH